MSGGRGRESYIKEDEFFPVFSNHPLPVAGQVNLQGGALFFTQTAFSSKACPIPSPPSPTWSKPETTLDPELIPNLSRSLLPFFQMLEGRGRFRWKKIPLRSDTGAIVSLPSLYFCLCSEGEGSWLKNQQKLKNKNKKNKSLKAGLLSPSGKGFSAWPAKICLDPSAVQLLWPGNSSYRHSGSPWERVF